MNSFIKDYEVWLQKVLSVKKNKIWILVAIMTCIIILFSWNSDDAYHAYVMARNLIRGNGFVYYPGYRVNAATCPLYTLLVALLSVTGIETNVAGVIINIVTSALAIAVLDFYLCDCFFWALFFDLVLVCNYSFISFTSGGLENSVAFLLSVVFIVYLNKIKDNCFCEKDLFILSCITGLVVLTRMDLVIVFLPTLIYVFFRTKESGFFKRLVIGFVGFIPFVAWEIFSLTYYGFLFPNTFYSKLNSGYSFASYVYRGIQYFYDSMGSYIIVLSVYVVLLILAIKEKKIKSFCVFCGIFLYSLYTISVGGDFMIGRFLTVPFFVAVCEVSAIIRDLSNNDERFRRHLINRMICVLVISALWTATIGSIILYTMDNSMVADERNAYSSYTGLEAFVDGRIKGTDYKVELFNELFEEICKKYENGTRVCQYAFIPGMMAYYSQDYLPDMYMFDVYGLMDPLITQLPGIKEEKYRTGHIKRDIPKGYVESLESGENRIEDPEIAEIYEKIKLITTGPIWDTKRWEYIWKML